MKIQFFGNNTFGAFGKNARVIFDPTDNLLEKNLDFTTNSNGNDPKGIIQTPEEY